jgi:hypothetical protein
MPWRRFVMNLRLPPQSGPRRYAHDYPRSGQSSRAIHWRPMLMLNYHTNARNRALVRFNPAARSRATRRLASPRRPPARFQALASLPSHALPSPAPSPLHFAPHLPPPPGIMLGSAVPPHLRPHPASGSAAPPACTPNHAWVPQPCPRVRSRRAWLRGAVPSLAPAVPGFACRPASRRPCSAPRRRPV